MPTIEPYLQAALRAREEKGRGEGEGGAVGVGHLLVNTLLQEKWNARPKSTKLASQYAARCEAEKRERWFGLRMLGVYPGNRAQGGCGFRRAARTD